VGLLHSRLAPAVAGFLALVLGFTVADLTNIRWLGGLVLLLIGAAGAVLLYQWAGLPRTLAAVGIVVLAFAISHPLGSVFGSYGSLVIVSALAALGIYMITPRREPA
jgi:hypothetical protein